MPEGHVLHREARLQAKQFVGRRVAAFSPQGRFEAGASRIDGQKLRKIHANGKHIFYRFDSADVLHIHLGLFGKFRRSKVPAPAPSPNARLVIETDRDHLHLAGPTVCELIDPDDEARLLARLGPDPILAPSDGASRIITKLSRRSIPIAAALMDQSVLSGIGNVYRSELLFVTGVHPFVVSNEVSEERIAEIWDRAVLALKQGERMGRIVTVEPSEMGADRKSELGSEDRLYAYKRDGEPCRRCGDLIVAADVDGRSAWWCPTCQPRP